MQGQLALIGIERLHNGLGIGFIRGLTEITERF